MVVRTCRSCDAVWRSDLTQCAFCGKDGEEQGAPPPARPNGSALPAPAPTAPPVAILERPAPPSRPAPAPIPLAPPAAELPTVLTSIPLPPPLPAKEEESATPDAPGLPSSRVPVVFGVLGLAAAALLPVAAWTDVGRTPAVLLFLGVAVLLSFGPLAWWTGARYDVRCARLGFRPAASARAGRRLGIGVTLLLAAEGAALAFLRALEHLRS